MWSDEAGSPARAQHFPLYNDESSAFLGWRDGKCAE
jgi:hypothetical protein